MSLELDREKIADWITSLKHSEWEYHITNPYSYPCVYHRIIERPRTEDSKPSVPDYDVRVKLLMLIGLPPVLKPDNDGLDKTRGLLSDSAYEDFDVVSFVKSMRED